jgi:hypothetical protein
MGAHKPTALFLYTDLKKEKSPLVNFEKSKFQHFNIIDLTSDRTGKPHSAPVGKSGFDDYFLLDTLKYRLEMLNFVTLQYITRYYY